MTWAFSAKAAHFLAELNAIHAFREGNGRAQLSFFAMLADHAGHPLDLDRLEAKEMLEAMIASFGGNEQKLTAIIDDRKFSVVHGFRLHNLWFLSRIHSASISVHSLFILWFYFFILVPNPTN